MDNKLKIAQRFAESIPDNNYKFLVEHPVAAAYRKEERWDSKGIFPEINRLLVKNNSTKIIW